MKKFRHLWCLALCFSTIAHADDFKNAWNSFAGSMSSLGDAFKSFGTGLIQSFGACPPGYYYSFRVFNNTNGTVSARARRLRQVQGVFFDGDIFEKHDIVPGQDTGTSVFNNLSLYLQVVLEHEGHQISTESIVDLLPAYKQKNIVYFFNVYQKSGAILSELLGTGKTTSPKFLGSIHNALSVPYQITFTYAQEQFTITLDPNSFNMLQGDDSIPNCIRPVTGSATLDCGKAGKISIPSYGIATGQQQDGQWTNVTPMNYHYEIVGTPQKPQAITNGLMPGNFNQANGERIRDITPVRCLIWNQSASQVNSGTEIIAVDQSHRSVWVVYDSPGWTNVTRTITNTVIAQIPSGQALQFYFIRPSIDAPLKLTQNDLLQTINLTPTKNFGATNTIKTLGINLNPVDIFAAITKQAPLTSKANLFVVSLDTTDPKKAQQFLQNLIAGKIPLPQAPSLTSTTLTQDIKSTLLAAPLSTVQGVLSDPQSGVSGYLLLNDIFTSYGDGSGPYFYVVPPPSVMISLVYSILLPYLNPENCKTEDQVAEIKKQIAQWITTAWQEVTKQARAQAVYDDVVAYLKTNGSDTIFAVGSDGKSDRNNFSWRGNMGLNMVVTGPSGIVNAPVQWQSGINYFVYNGPSMPVSIDPKSGKSTTLWKPAQTVGLDGQPAQFVPQGSQPAQPTSAAASTKAK